MSKRKRNRSINRNKNANRRKFNARRLKCFLKENKIYFETVGIGFLTLMSIVVTISSNRISNSQLELDKTQTEIVIAEQKPFLIFNGIKPDEYGSRYSFVNAGGKIFNPSVYITDDIFILVTNPNSKSIGTIDINVNQRFEYPRIMYENETVLLCISEQKEFKSIESLMDEISASLKIEDNIKCSFNNGKRIIFKYTDYLGQPQTENYTLINKNTQLIKDGSPENPYYMFRDNQIDYNIITDNKENMIKKVNEKINNINW